MSNDLWVLRDEGVVPPINRQFKTVSELLWWFFHTKEQEYAIDVIGFRLYHQICIYSTNNNNNYGHHLIHIDDVPTIIMPQTIIDILHNYLIKDLFVIIDESLFDISDVETLCDEVAFWSGPYQ